MGIQQVRAKKSLGQHFLRNAAAIRRIVAAVPEGVTVLEIGPGTGALSEGLLARAARLILVEKDDDLAAAWRRRAETEPKLRAVHGDVMRWLPKLVDEERPQWIVGNLPYNISGPLTAMLAGIPLPGGMVVMVQREVGERLLAGPGGKRYGGLSVLVRHHYRIERLMRLPPEAFAPPPKVHSMVLRFAPHGKPPACPYADLQRAVRLGFAHRRKTVANNFRHRLAGEDWRRLGIDERLRPEQLDHAAWVRIARLLAERGRA